MDRISLKHILVLNFLIVGYVQLTKASSDGCRWNLNLCSWDEFCDKGHNFLGRCIKRREYEGYKRVQQEWERSGQEKNVRREEISQWRQPYRHQDYSEPTLEDKNLIQSLPLDNKDIHSSYPNRELPPGLPAENIATRDGISSNNKLLQDAREYHSEALEEPRQTFHEANEQISIEHISEPQTKTLHDEKEDSSFDANSKVMINGEVKKAESSIDQGPNPEKNYERIKDFFKSQQASSIVDVPNSVKREEASKDVKKNFLPVNNKVKDEINAEEAEERVSKPMHVEFDRRVKKAESKLQRSNNVRPEDGSNVAKRINQDSNVKEGVAREISANILKADDDTPSKYDKKIEHSVNQQPKYFAITLITAGCVTGVILSAVAIYLIMKRYNETKKFKPVTLPGQEAASEYQELCRQFRASQGWEGSPMKPSEKEKALGSSKPPPYSWSEEPVVPNMDISTGHVVLAYMEDHLKNKDRLSKEWEALCSYEAEPNKTDIGKQDKNARKNRYSDVLPYDHNRVMLRETANATGSDYINASFITDHDPRNPAYIATQGPLAHSISDFWQMIWEQGVVVVVNLTRLSDLGLPQCNRYWPEEGHETYHIYEVHLVSEHIWCDDYLVRSFYLKNLQTSETRTVTQFHFLSWPDLNVPTNPKPLLEFRRKVNKCFRGRSCPIVVHCSGGVGRTGCYILIDMVLNKMMRGAKEIDIAATVEHLRDQRPLMVKTKAQFEFALTAVAEEVSAILQALAK